jgi:tetratricopeptide (TPR) repeat protein
MNKIIKQAFNLLQEGKFQEAELQYRKILKAKPNLAIAHHNLGVVLKNIGNSDEAIISFKKAIELKPDYIIAHYNLGITFNEIKKFGEAVQSFKNAITLKPDYIEAYNNLGNSLFQINKLEDAILNFKKVTELKPEHPEAYYNLSNIFYKLNRFDEAVTNYRITIKLVPSFAEAHNNLGNALYQLNRFDESEEAYKNAIKFKPNYAQVYNNLATSLNHVGRLEEAEANYRKAIELKPNFADAYNNLGVTLKNLGRLEEAELSCQKAIELEPDFVKAYKNLGNILHNFGKIVEAETSYKRAISLKPDFDVAHKDLGILYFEYKQLIKAAEQFKLSDSDICKCLLLKCFFILDQQSNFYNHLDSIMDKGINNALIGNLISSAKIKYGIDKPNPFCNDPLNYVSKTDLITQCNFKDIFIKGATDILTSDKIQNRKQGLLTNGIQTAGNIFTQGGAVTNEMQKIIYAEVEKYKIKFKDSDEGFLKKWPTNYQINGWIVSMKSGGNLSPHMHEMGWISGSVYINVPPKSEIDSGNLVVCIDEASKKSTEKQYKKSLDVVTGSLCLFPSSLLHYTIPFEAEEDRIVLAFDIIRDIEKNI